MKQLSTVLVAAALLAFAACGTQNANVAAGDAGLGSSGCSQDCTKAVAAQCYEGSCNELTGKCEVVPSPAGTACDDGLYCTVGETCNQGVCGNGKPNPCGASECVQATCDESARQCKLAARADNTPCTVHGDACSVGATCQSGQCIGTPKDCSYAPGIDECHVATCNPATGACEVAPGNDGAACHAQPNCWANQTCLKGACQGGMDLDVGQSDGFDGGISTATACGDTVCNPANGAYSPTTVPIGSPCHAYGTGECISATCEQGTPVAQCQRVAKTGASCTSVADDCSFGTCDGTGRCDPSPTNEGAACDDRDSCTTGTTCHQGSCTGALKNGVTVYYKDDFGSGNLTGWTFEQGPTSYWTIQPAVAIDQQQFMAGPGGMPQPEADHTATMDQEMLACVGGQVGDFVDSPAIDLSAATGSVWLSLWMVPQTQAGEYLDVSIFDGTHWLDVWTSPVDTIVDDYAWTPYVFDVTSFKSANFKFRFGFILGSSAPWVQPGATDSLYIDDIMVSNQPCAPDATTSGSGGGGGGGK